MYVRMCVYLAPIGDSGLGDVFDGHRASIRSVAFSGVHDPEPALAQHVAHSVGAFEGLPIAQTGEDGLQIGSVFGRDAGRHYFSFFLSENI